MIRINPWISGAFSLLGPGVAGVEAEQSVAAVEIGNPNWAIRMTPEGYSDVAIDKRPGFVGREYFSGEWAAAIIYDGGSDPEQPIWFRKTWVFPCWESNSNFAVDEPIGLDSPATNGDSFQRFKSRINNGDVEVAIQYEMVDTGTGIKQGIERESTGGAGDSTDSDRYVLVQTYTVKIISPGGLSGVRFYHFLHGLKSGISLYDNRDYMGPMGAYRFDNTQQGTSLSFHSVTGEIHSHDDTVCMHAMDQPSAFECNYYGKDLGPGGVDDHRVGKPSVGAHLSVEDDRLNGVDFFDPPEERWVSGAMCSDFPDLAEGESHVLTVLLSIRSVSNFVAPPPQMAILDASIEGSEFVIDFEETTGAPIDLITNFRCFLRIEPFLE